MEEEKPKRKRGRKMIRKKPRGRPKKPKSKKKPRPVGRPRKKRRAKKIKIKVIPYKYEHKMSKLQKMKQANMDIKRFLRTVIIPELLYELKELVNDPNLPPEWFEAADTNITERILERIIVLDENI